MAAPRPTGGEDLFDAYFRRADLDGDGHISGAEAVAFFQGSNLPKHVLAQVWAYADSKKAGYLGRGEFYNALKLVTVAQSKRELTPEIVKAALYSPASANIPAPKINLAATPSPQPRAGVPVTQATGVASLPPSSAGIRGTQIGGNISTNNQQAVSSQQFPGPPQTTIHTAPSQPQQNLRIQGMPTGGSSAPRPVIQPLSSDWLNGRTVSPLGQVNSQVPPGPNTYGLTPPNSTVGPQPRPHMTSGAMTAKPQELVASHRPQGSSAPPVTHAPGPPSNLSVSGNGSASDSLFGDVFSVAVSQPKQQSTMATPSMSSSSVPAGTVVASQGGAQPVVTQNSVQPQGQQPVGVQNQFTGKPGLQFTPSGAASGPASSPSGAGNSSPSQVTQPQAPWPKMMPADVQKYAKVFVQVDTDRDGKITGHQARNLFLSWKLPREILKQIWDLSDQDNDSMLSLREFCIAVYLMERYREGRPLPPVLPSTVITNENMFSAPGQPVAQYGNASYGAARGLQQQQVPGAARPPPIPKGKPPRPVPASHSDGTAEPTPPKRKVPVLEKHLVDQLSKEEQGSLNSKFEEAVTVDNKVEELEKEIADSKQKIEFFRAKMQELVLYKSRCDNRFNEITERVSADKREVETLAKKYEEKYKQSGNVGSKLTIEEATFRDIQEKKMELYQAIVKFEEGNPDDSVIKERTERIQSGLEELVKNLNERCKQYGLRGKPTSLVELPFGWQPGIQEGAADWDEDWDKLEEEGYAFVKELTLDVQNVVAPPKEKTPIDRKESIFSAKEGSDVSPVNGDSKTEKVPSTGEDDDAETEPISEQSEAKTPESGDRHKNGFHDESGIAKGIEADGSPISKDTRRDHVHDDDGESTASAGKTFEEPGWGNFDSHYDTDSVSSFKLDTGKDKDIGFGFGFGFDDFSIKPIKTGSTSSENLFPGKISIFSDSVPSTPADAGLAFPGKPSLFADSVPSTPANATTSFTGKKSSFFDDSVPSTPAYAGNIFPEKSSFFDDSVPSTPAYAGNLFPEKKSSFFDDSVPSTPAYSMSDFGGKPFSSETPRSDNLFPGRSPFMFDSVPSTPAHKSSDDYSFNTFSRFDSFNSAAGENNVEPDPFASSRFDTFEYQRYDSFNSQGLESGQEKGGLGQNPKPSLARFDSIQSTGDSDYSHGFGFDDSDPFGSSGPFKSMAAETPRRSSDHWNAF
ncbi:PREDICTED: epidermal growth factor receptor substrate 15-like 1 [Tarenaya hassleriana]|uniref:epidermal growth factor receptor substrate 15-like 1 n=1 Tax=Tarenaya hassleriana TaxID=28532 RepID=UPI00053C63DC|nr:PREDICTED: epidermal growth factor receptor substrate 15-like 1 [Tarenaya hassleriana]